MTEPDRLPPDQRAVLSLVLDRGKSYAEVAAMLAIPEATVRERAHAALDTLAAGAPPAPSPGVSSPAVSHPAPSPGTADPAGESRASSAPAGAARPSSAGTPTRPAPNSRLGGAVLLAGIVVAVVIAVVLLTGGGKGSGNKGSAAGATSTTSASSTSTSTSSGNAKARIDKKLTLAAVEPESRAGGEAYVLSDGSRHAFYVAAQGLPPSHGFFYAVWLYNSPSSSAPLGRAPSVGSNGRLEGGGPLPSNAADYAKLIVTRETSTHARRPGTIVLSGDFSLR